GSSPGHRRFCSSMEKAPNSKVRLPRPPLGFPPMPVPTCSPGFSRADAGKHLIRWHCAHENLLRSTRQQKADVRSSRCLKSIVRVVILKIFDAHFRRSRKVPNHARSAETEPLSDFTVFEVKQPVITARDLAVCIVRHHQEETTAEMLHLEGFGTGERPNVGFQEAESPRVRNCQQPFDSVAYKTRVHASNLSEIGKH